MPKEERKKGTHLTWDDRHEIQKGLKEHRTFKEIAYIIGCSPDTVSKEIRRHRYHKLRNRDGILHASPNRCKYRNSCRRWDVCKKKKGHKCRIPCRECISCNKLCPDFVDAPCPIEHKAPYVCNNCPKSISCLFDKYLYNADYAHKEYCETLRKSRQGIDMTRDELAALDSLVSPLIRKGQPLAHILANHAEEIPCGERTLYKYISAGYLTARNLDMRRTVRYRKRVRSVPTPKISYVFEVAYTEATANSDWTTYDSIGGLQPSANDEGHEVIEGKNGYVVSSILKCCDLIVKNENDNGTLQGNWLILDELNRCEIDKVFGDLFTALGSDASETERVINLWYQKDENKKMVYIPNRYRIIGAMNNIDKNFVNDISQGLSRRFTFIDIMPPQEIYFQNEAKNAKKLAMTRVIDKVKEFGKAIIDDDYMNDLDALDEFNEIENTMLELFKKIRYSHQNDESYLGLQVGTAQIIDLYESIYISMIVADVKNIDKKGECIKDIIDSTFASRIIPQLDGYDYNKLAMFYDNVKDESAFSYLKRTKEAIYRFIH